LKLVAHFISGMAILPQTALDAMTKVHATFSMKINAFENPISVTYDVSRPKECGHFLTDG
jgi:hypothetical protein